MPILENLCRALGLRNLSVMPANANALNLHMPLSVDEHWGAEPPNPPSREDAEAFVKAQPFWYHRIYLGNGPYTIPDAAYHESVWQRVNPAFPADPCGASVLEYVGRTRCMRSLE